MVQALIFGDLAGIRRFVFCDIGANHCSLRHIGWEKCGHGLTSRRKVFLNVMLVLFGYPSGSAAALLGGELPLRYCSGKFACPVPTWGLPARGHVQGLLTDFAGIGEVSRAQLPGLVGGAGVLGGRRILGGVKRVRLHRKSQHTLQELAGMGVLSLVQGSGRD